MSDQGIKSRPSYAPLAFEPAARFRLLVVDTSAADERAFAEGNAASRYNEIWTVERASHAIPSHHAGERAHGFRAPKHLLIALPGHLAAQRMGFRLHAIGAEPFLWDVAAVATAAGLGRDEYALFAVGSQARHVFCVHCRTITPAITTNVAACSGCGATLFVRDHFSRRLNAFMGFQIDAEAPGEIPPVETLYA